VTYTATGRARRKGPVGRTIIAAIGVATIVCVSAAAAPDSLAPLPEIETIAVSARSGILPSAGTTTRHQMTRADIETLAPVIASDILARLPSARVASNSRGQSIITLRGAGDRQVGVFFDGAPINIPWDNRYDLDSLPAAAIGSVETVTGPMTAGYGVNTLGAVLITPDGGPQGTDARLYAGSGKQAGGDIRIRGGDGPNSWLAAASLYRRSGLTLPDSPDLPFHQNPARLRTNTDMLQRTALLRGSRQLGSIAVSATLLYSASERGTAPESDRVDARFWRYPVLRSAVAILRAQTAIGGTGAVDITAWGQDHRQQIDSFRGADYQQLDDRQRDKDRSYGLRAQYRHSVGAAMFTLSGSLHRADHSQRDTATGDGAAGDSEASSGDQPGISPATDRTANSHFAQSLMSAGLDIRLPTGPASRLEASIGIDRADYTDTDVFDPVPAFTEPVLRIAWTSALSGSVSVRAAVGQKSRMPTMRDLFGTAINRFLVNPDLRAERIRTAELGASWTAKAFDLQITGFFQSVSDSIDQIRVGDLRQRVNLDASRIWGLETAGRAQLGDHITVLGQLTWLRGRRRITADATDARSEDQQRADRRLTERPDLLARAAIDYRMDAGHLFGAELQYTGRAYSPDASGTAQALPRQASLNTYMRIAVLNSGRDTSRYGGNQGNSDRGDRASGSQTVLFGRADNLLGSTTLPQAGLPAAGRTIRFGLDVTF